MMVVKTHRPTGVKTGSVASTGSTSPRPTIIKLPVKRAFPTKAAKPAVVKKIDVCAKLKSVGAALNGADKMSQALMLRYGPEIFRLTHVLKYDPDQLQRFCKHTDWNAQKSKPGISRPARKSLLRFAISFALRLDKTLPESFANAVSRMLSPAWKEGVSSADIESYIREVQSAKKKKSASYRKEKQNEKCVLQLIPGPKGKELNAIEEGKEFYIHAKKCGRTSRHTLIEVIEIYPE